MKTNTIEELAKLHPDLIKKVSNKMKTATWLPVFNGFYNTIFEANNNDDFINEDLREYFSMNDVTLAEQEKINNFLFDSKEYERAIKEYELNVCKSVVTTIEKELKKLKVIESIEFEKLVSPREYNFVNDSINIEITFTKQNIKEIKKIIAENKEEWEEFLKDHYTSHDGFISHYDNYAESDDWKDINNCLNHGHKSGSILHFICQLNDINEKMLFERLMDDSVYMFVNIENVINEMKEKGK